MQIETHDDILILVCAFRYALGRATYMPLIVKKEIKKQWENMTQHDRRLFQNEIREAIELDCAGMDIDARMWAELLELPST